MQYSGQISGVEYFGGGCLGALKKQVFMRALIESNEFVVKQELSDFTQHIIECIYTDCGIMPHAGMNHWLIPLYSFKVLIRDSPCYCSRFLMSTPVSNITHTTNTPGQTTRASRSLRKPDVRV